MTGSFFHLVKFRMTIDERLIVTEHKKNRSMSHETFFEIFIKYFSSKNTASHKIYIVSLSGFIKKLYTFQNGKISGSKNKNRN